jgi:hypothetical protein
MGSSFAGHLKLQLPGAVRFYAAIEVRASWRALRRIRKPPQ